MYLVSPFTFTTLTRWPRLRRWFGPIGLILTAFGFLMSSFATKVWPLVATQGVICALGCGLLFTPITLYLDEWFVKRKGLAYGVMWTGKFAAGVGVPFAIELCLQKFGSKVTLQPRTAVPVCKNVIPANSELLLELGLVLGAPPLFSQTTHPTLPVHSYPQHQLRLHLPSFFLDVSNRYYLSVSWLFFAVYLYSCLCSSSSLCTHHRGYCPACSN